MLHSQLVISENHTAYAFTYANAGARTGDTSRTSADLGKFARQLDDNSIWMLTSTTPTWQKIGPTIVDVVNTFTLSYTINGTIEVTTGTLRRYPDRNITITGVYFSVGVAGTDTTEIDVLKNGTSIFTTKPSVEADVYKSTTETVSVSVSTTDYITIDVTQAGGASDAVVIIIYE